VKRLIPLLTVLTACSLVLLAGWRSSGDSMAQIANDMGVNDAPPHGVPSSFGFYTGSVINQGNSPPSTSAPAFVYWGTVYIPATGNRSVNTRVNIRDCRAYWKRTSTGAWTSFGPETPRDIADYPEDFQGRSVRSNVRTELDGSISVFPQTGKTSHFNGPYPRIPVPYDDVAGIVTVCEARLIKDDPAGIDDRNTAKFLINMGADYYQSVTGSGIENNPSIGGSRFQFVTTAWRSFAFTTLSYAQLVSDPPPVDMGQTVNP
jgi:hypothetical protein